LTISSFGINIQPYQEKDLASGLMNHFQCISTSIPFQNDSPEEIRLRDEFWRLNRSPKIQFPEFESLFWKQCPLAKKLTDLIDGCSKLFDEVEGCWLIEE